MSTWPHGRSADGGIDEIPLGGIAGRLWLCGKHVVGPDPDAAMARVGATGVICFNERHEIDERYPHYVDWLVRQPPERALWFPTPDLGVRHDDDVAAMLELAAHRLRLGDPIIAHCGAGIGRAGTFAACVLLVLGHSVDDALATVARHRPMAGPEAGSQRELVARIARRTGRRAVRVGPVTDPHRHKIDPVEFGGTP